MLNQIGLIRGIRLLDDHDSAFDPSSHKNGTDLFKLESIPISFGTVSS
jgi:hypothetical protein